MTSNTYPIIHIYSIRNRHMSNNDAVSLGLPKNKTTDRVPFSQNPHFKEATETDPSRVKGCITPKNQGPGLTSFPIKALIHCSCQHEPLLLVPPPWHHVPGSSQTRTHGLGTHENEVEARLDGWLLGLPGIVV